MAERRLPGPVPGTEINGIPVVPEGTKVLGIARGPLTSSEHLSIFVPGMAARRRRVPAK